MRNITYFCHTPLCYINIFYEGFKSLHEIIFKVPKGHAKKLIFTLHGHFLALRMIVSRMVANTK